MLVTSARCSNVPLPSSIEPVKVGLGDQRVPFVLHRLLLFHRSRPVDYRLMCHYPILSAMRVYHDHTFDHLLARVEVEQLEGVEIGRSTESYICLTPFEDLLQVDPQAIYALTLIISLTQYSEVGRVVKVPVPEPCGWSFPNTAPTAPASAPLPSGPERY